MPYNSKQIELKKLFHTDGIGLQKVEFPDYFYSFRVDGKDHYPTNDLALNDGLSMTSFESWFKGYDLSKPMALIHFTGFRYL